MGVACTLPPSHLPPQALPNWSDQWLLPESQAPVASLTHGNQTAQVVTWPSARPPVSSQRPPGRGGEGRGGAAGGRATWGPAGDTAKGWNLRRATPASQDPKGYREGRTRGNPRCLLGTLLTGCPWALSMTPSPSRPPCTVLITSTPSPRDPLPRCLLSPRHPPPTAPLTSVPPASARRSPL